MYSETGNVTCTVTGHATGMQRWGTLPNPVVSEGRNALSKTLQNKEVESAERKQNKHPAVTEVPSSKQGVVDDVVARFPSEGWKATLIILDLLPQAVRCTGNVLSRRVTRLDMLFA